MQRKSIFALLNKALFACSSAIFSLNATPLEEYIKSVDFSGVIRYRYDTGFISKDKTGFADSRGLIASKQDHRWLANFGTKVAIDDSFKAFLQVRYGPTKEDGYSGRLTNTKSPLVLRQSYFEYDNQNLGINFIGGKQQMNSIWSENYYDGLVGIGAKFTFTLTQSLNLQAFAFDSYNADEQGGQGGDLGYVMGANGTPNTAYDILPLYNYNLYGGALLGNFSSVGLKTNLWFAYMDESLSLYAFDLGYNLKFSDNASFSLAANYLGNTMQGVLKRAINGDNGNFVGLKAAFALYGFDMSLGGMFYGKKDKFTLTVLEDTGDISTIGGQEMIYTDGSHLTGAKGQNLIGYAALGYSFFGIRVGGDVAYADTKVKQNETYDLRGGKKLELVGRLGYKASKKLNFTAFYSHIKVDGDEGFESSKNTTRVQMVYKF